MGDDIVWMWRQLHHSSHLPDPIQNYLMQYHPGYWKRLVRRAGDHAAAQRDNQYMVEVFHRNVLETLHHHGSLLMQWAPYRHPSL